MGISAVSGSTSLDAKFMAQTVYQKPGVSESNQPEISSTKAKPGGETHRAHHAGGDAKPLAAAPKAAEASSTSSSSSSTKVYDKKDTNKDGTVSFEEEQAYAAQHPDDTNGNQAANAQSAAAQNYNRSGKAANPAIGVSTFNLFA